MISRCYKTEEQRTHAPHADEYISPAPRVSVQAFCATVATATTVRAASEDRRLGKAHLSVHMGGIAAAIDTYHKAPTPNVIMLETEADSDILDGLDELAGVCDRRHPRRRDRQRQRCRALSRTGTARRQRLRRRAGRAARRCALDLQPVLGVRRRRRRPRHRRGRRQGRRRRLHRRA